MSWILTIVAYGLAYTFLSVCVGLVLGRVFRTMNPMEELDTPEIIESRSWVKPDYRAGVPDRLRGAATS